MITVIGMGFSKLHSSLVNSSLWCERDDVRILFITMLALADRDGHVYGSKAGIFRQANITFDGTIKDPFEILTEPDSDSSDLMRNPENEGCRIRAIPGGFEIINYAYYRGLRNDDDRREQNRVSQQRFRKNHKPQSASVSQRKPRSAHAEAEAEADKEKRGAKASRSTSDSDWLAELSKDPTYTGIDVSREHGKMAAWCNTNQKEPTRRRFINWLNRADRSMSSQPQMSPEHRQNRINFLNEKKKKTMRLIKDPVNPPSWAEKELAGIDAELKQL